MNLKKIARIDLTVVLTVTMLCLHACREPVVPKPKGYFRIDLPAKEYRLADRSNSILDMPLSFEYPVYGKISKDQLQNSDPGWFNIEFPEFRAKIYLTYKSVHNNLPELIEQSYTMNVKNHITKADAIEEQVVDNNVNKVYGILYDLKGNTATAVQFYVTDSTSNYLRGSLYFNTEPNPDSLAPVINFFRADIVHLLETLKWENTKSNVN
jgi:gliding motility-associated lipoprotein GldD